MVKHVKNRYKKKLVKFKVSKKVNFFSLRKKRRWFRNSRFFLRSKRSFNSLFFIKKLRWHFFIHFKIRQNNVFCNFRNKKKTLLNINSGSVKVKVTKKRLNFNYRFVVEPFLSKILKSISKKRVLVAVECPSRLKKGFSIYILKKLRTSKLLLNFDPLKVFNGCRPSKQKRKKRVRFRVLV